MSATADPIRVLHVDDEPGLADLARTFLEESDDRITVRTAADAAEGMAALSDSRVDCVVSDYDMPGRNGIEFLERVREAHPELPFILYTGKGSEEVAGEAISKGVTDYLQKSTGTEQYSILANRIANAVEKRRAQRETRTVRRRFEAVLENTTTPMFMKDDRDEYLFVNRAYRELFGLEDADVVGRTDAELLPDDVAEELRAGDAAVIDRGESVEVEERIPTDDGERVFLTTKMPIHDVGTRSDPDDPVAVFGVGTDITDRKRQSRRLETLISNLPGIVYRARNDHGWPIEVVRGDCERLTGYPAAALQRGDVVWGEDVLHPDERDRMWESVQDALANDDPFEVTYRIRTADGETRWLWERGRAVDTPDGDVLEGFIIDITERTERERELTRIKRQYETVFADPNILVAHIDTDGTLVDVNPTAMEYVDADRDDVLGEPFRETPWFDHSAAAREAVDARIDRARSGEYAEFEGDRVRPNGEPYAVEGVFRPVTDDGGAVVSILVSARDVTDYRDRTEELAAERDRYQSLFENSPLVIWEQDHSEAMASLSATVPEAVDVETYLLEHPEEIDRLLDRVEVRDVNRNALPYYDADSKAELMDNLDAVMVEETAELLAAQWAAFADGATEFRTETEARTLSGDRIEELLQVVVPEDAAEDYSRVYVIGTDITDQKRRERRLKRQNERLDQFTSVVSHDLRNPLHVASARVELAAEECDSPHLRTAAEAHDRMERLIDDLLTFARAGSQAIDFEPVALPKLLDACWSGLPTDGASLAVETAATVRADRDRLRQLFENLLLNGVEHGSTSNRTKSDDAVEHGSTGPRSEGRGDSVEHGSTSNRTKSDDAVEHGSTGPRSEGRGDSVEHGSTSNRTESGNPPESDGTVSITVGDLDDGSGFYVADDGPGIDPADRQTVFEAGYSTAGTGTGFGLSIVAEVAEAHGWAVAVADADSGGARFEVSGVEVVDDASP